MTSIGAPGRPSAPGGMHRRRRHAPMSGPVPGQMPTYGYRQVELPPGSRRLGPLQRGDQGISPGERPHAEQAIRRLFDAPGVDMVALYDQADAVYELRSRTGSMRWERWATPQGDLRYRIVSLLGDDPIPGVDAALLRTIDDELAAAGGRGNAVPRSRDSYPDILQRLSQLFDHPRAPDFVHIPTPGGDPNHPGAGSHGIPDIVQSRAPLIIAGPGIARSAVSDLIVRHEDIAPTVAELIGVRPVVGTNATGVRRMQLLRWQDGSSIAGSIADARLGARVRGSAERVLVLTVDGLSQTALQDELRAGGLPNIARIMAAGTVLRNGSLAEYPVVTWANHNTIVTGTSPGHHGLVNNSWYERSQQRERRITDGSGTNVLRTGTLMNPLVETLYEAVERSFSNVQTVAINQPSGRGADVSVLDLVGIPILVQHVGRLAVNMLRGFADLDDAGRRDSTWRNQSISDIAGTAMVETLWSQSNAPKLGVVEFTMVDEKGHSDGPHDPVARRALRQVDRQIGRILDTLERRGIAGSTAIVLTADHGMAHQANDAHETGGWAKAIKLAARDGAKVVDSTRFVYVRSVNWMVAGDVPPAGGSGTVQLVVTNDDENQRGDHAPVEGAVVTLRDGRGTSWTGVTGADGTVRIQVAPIAGPLGVVIEHADFSRELGTIALAQPSSGLHATSRRRRSIRR